MAEVFMDSGIRLYADPETLRRHAQAIAFLPQDSPELPQREAILREKLAKCLLEATESEKITAGDLNAIVR